MATYNWDPNDFLQDSIHMPWVAKNADEQLGKLIAKLKELQGPAQRHADHRDRRPRLHLRCDPGGFKGVNALNAGSNVNWYAGSWHAGSTTESSNEHRLACPQPLMDTGNVQFSYQSTAIETWLKDRTGRQEA